MRRSLTLALVASLWLSLLGACSDSAPGGDADGAGLDAGREAAIDGPDDAQADAAPDAPLVAPPPALREVKEGRFATSLVCATCHQNVNPKSKAMRDAKGRAVAPYDLWRATMMANAARDPLWRAVVSAEVAAAPALAAEIEAKCLRCHAPMASAEAAMNGEPPPRITLLATDTARAQLAVDGVSCTACHQITADKLGSDASFTGGFVVNDSKQVYGPHQDVYVQPMSNTGYTPVQGAHILRSALCASCHTLSTDTLDSTGAPTGGVFHEQTPYIEWQNSIYNDEIAAPSAKAASCQACHEPQKSVDGTPITTALATRDNGLDHPAFLVPPRSPYGRHLFIGGNTLIPALLRDNAAALNPTAPAAAFDEVIARAREQLAQRTATLTIEGATVTADVLRFGVRVTNLTGHKLPTGYPARRLWLAVQVKDSSGATVLWSGRHDGRGRILGADGTPLASERAGGPVRKHVITARSADDVPIYQSLMADSDGRATFRLLRGARYLKDNRLLPEGWSESFANIARIAVAGDAGSDADFAGGGDRVAYELPLPASSAAPYTIVATLYYQVASPRYLAELYLADTAAVRALRVMLERADVTPTTVASQTVTTP